MKLAELTQAPKIDAILNAQNVNGFEKPGGTDKQTLHSYGPVYEELMRPLMDKECTVLEVGVQLGGSILLWHDLLPKCFVIGVDIEKSYHESVPTRMDKERHALLIQDAYTSEAINRIKELAPDGLDLAIDDGPHSLQSQIDFLRLYLPLLKKGGVAVVEDIQSPSWYDSLLAEVPSTMSIEEVDIRGRKGRYDDLMLVVRNDQ
jgi:hypothetical protein